MKMQHWWNDDRKGKTESTRRKNSSSAPLSTTNPTSTARGLNPDLGGEKPETNCLNPGVVRTDIICKVQRVEVKFI
jgi:hypothetical protein